MTTQVGTKKGLHVRKEGANEAGAWWDDSFKGGGKPSKAAEDW